VLTGMVGFFRNSIGSLGFIFNPKNSFRRI
jgi:hypothetical protein